jgi:hypothetical protein
MLAQARSQRTRAQVAEAMLNCLVEGILLPSAKQVIGHDDSRLGGTTCLASSRASSAARITE